MSFHVQINTQNPQQISSSPSQQRIATLKQPEIYGTKSSTNELSLSLGLSIQSSAPTADKINSSIAIRRLKQAQREISIIKSRFKVIKFKQLSKKAKTIHHENVQRLQKSIAMSKQLQREELKKIYDKKQEQKNQIRKRSQKLREEIMERKKSIKDELINSKREKYRKIKTQSANNQRKYEEYKSLEKDVKEYQRHCIYEHQKQLKEKIQMLKFSRVETAMKSKSADLQYILQALCKKEKELEHLIQKEKQVLQQQQQKQESYAARIQASRISKQKQTEFIYNTKLKKSIKNKRKLEYKNNLNDFVLIQINLPSIKTKGNSRREDREQKDKEMIL